MSAATAMRATCARCDATSDDAAIVAAAREYARTLRERVLLRRRLEIEHGTRELDGIPDADRQIMDGARRSMLAEQALFEAIGVDVYGPTRDGEVRP